MADIVKVEASQQDYFKKMMTGMNSEEFRQFKKKYDAFAADGDFCPPSTGLYWMADTITMIKEFEPFQRLKTKPEGWIVINTYKMPTSEEASNYVSSAKRPRVDSVNLTTPQKKRIMMIQDSVSSTPRDSVVY
jgi:hypothetical protein